MSRHGKRATVLTIVLLLWLGLSGCSTEGGDYDPKAPGGPGMTYNGKQGVDMGGGFVLPYDGSGPQLGYGF